MMSEIQPTGSSYAPGEIARTGSARRSAAPVNEGQSAADRVEISDLAYWRAEAARLPEVREAKVAEVRAAIESGSYESDEKLSVALDRMIEDLLT